MLTDTSQCGGQLTEPRSSLPGSNIDRRHMAQFHPLRFIAVKALATNENTSLIFPYSSKEKT